MRRACRLLHRWIGLAAALVLALSGASGTLLLVTAPLDRALNDHLHRAGAPIGAPALDAAHRALVAEFPQAQLSFRLPRRDGDALQVHVRGPWEGEAYFDAAGRELGRRGETEGLHNLLFELHSTLLAHEAGKAVLFAAALAYVVLLLVGLAAWWPRRWAGALRVELRRGWRRAAFDLHRAGGALLGALVLVSVASGAYMAWRPIASWVNWLAGTPPLAVPRLAPASAARDEPLPLSALLAAADRALPQGRPSIVQWPAHGAQAVRVRKQLPDEVHPNGLSSVWLDPRSGQVLRVLPWRQGDAGLLGFEFLYPLHAGKLGGTAHQVLIGAAGLALLGLCASGPALWLARRPWARGRAGQRRRHEEPGGPAS